MRCIWHQLLKPSSETGLYFNAFAVALVFLGDLLELLGQKFEFYEIFDITALLLSKMFIPILRRGQNGFRPSS